MGMLFSTLFGPLTALLVAVVVPVLLGVFFGGWSPPLKLMPDWQRVVASASFARWAVAALLTDELSDVPRHLEIVRDGIFFKTGFTLDDWTYAVGMLFLLGAIFRSLSFFALVGRHRGKQR
ncbi:MAG: hypothetical protein MHM6MM_004488 [Cercozoa sp. M6MM]